MTGINPTGASPAGTPESAPPKASDILEKAADLIEPEGRWTQHVLARHANGHPIGPREDNAMCWCALGAVLATADDGALAEGEAIRHLFSVVPYGDVGAWNDAPGRTQAEVVARLREAASLARGEGQ